MGLGKAGFHKQSQLLQMKSLECFIQKPQVSRSTKLIGFSFVEIVIMTASESNFKLAAERKVVTYSFPFFHVKIYYNVNIFSMFQLCKSLNMHPLQYITLKTILLKVRFQGIEELVPLRFARSV